MALEMVKAVFFDFGDTLVTLVPSREELFMQASGVIGLKLDFETVKRAYEIVDFHNEYSSLAITHSKARDVFYENYNRQICEVLGISGYFVKLHPYVVSQFRERRRWRLVRDVPLVLRSLHQMHIPLAIVANWDRNLTDLTEVLGIRNYFFSIVSSQETGIEKPNPAIFTRVLNNLSLYAKDDCILYIGNDYRIDVLCARAAGLVPILVDRNNLYPYADCLRFNSIMEWFKFLNSTDNINDNFTIEEKI